MVNGAFFVASGEGMELQYEKAYSVEPKSAVLIDQLIMHAGALGVGGRDNNLGKWSSDGDGNGLGSGPDYTDDMSGSSSILLPPLPSTYTVFSFFISLSCLLVLYIIPDDMHL